MAKLGDQLFDAVLSGDDMAAAAIRREMSASGPKHVYDGQAPDIAPDYAKTLSDINAGPIRVANRMTELFGSDWINWEHNTIRVKLDELNVVADDIVLDRIFAIKACCSSPEPMSDWFAFNQCCTALCAIGADFTTFVAPTPGMVLFTASFLKVLHPGVEFEEEIIKYICSIFNGYGIHCPPPDLFDECVNVMRWTTSKDIQQLWHDIYLQYNDLAQGKTLTYDVVGVQAHRLYDAESAAAAYAGA